VVANLSLLLAESQTLPWERVKSSNLAAVAYDPDNRRMYVEFLDRPKQPASLYVYYEVPPSVYQGMLAAGSKGKYLDAAVKKAGYRSDKIY
jgi:hypothetical protein